jgi:predicted esterase
METFNFDIEERNAIEVNMNEYVETDEGEILFTLGADSCIVVGINPLDNESGCLFHGTSGKDAQKLLEEAASDYDPSRTEVFVRGGSTYGDVNAGDDRAAIREYLRQDWGGKLTYIQYNNNHHCIDAALDPKFNTFVSKISRKL